MKTRIGVAAAIVVLMAVLFFGLFVGIARSQGSRVIFSDKAFAYSSSGESIATNDFESPVMIVIAEQVTILTPKKQVYSFVGENAEDHTFYVVEAGGEKAILSLMENSNGFFLVLQFKEYVIGYRLMIGDALPPAKGVQHTDRRIPTTGEFRSWEQSATKN